MDLLQILKAILYDFWSAMLAAQIKIKQCCMRYTKIIQQSPEVIYKSSTKRDNRYK